MKSLRVLAIILLCNSFSTFLLAQPCPPVGFPQPGNTCPQAPILCANLDGYCATINNSNMVQNFPGCGGSFVLNNDEWFAFYAGTTSITIQVVPNNCTQGPNQGLQGGIYAGCGPPWVPMDVQCQCTENPFILQSSNFVVGQIYWFVLDGCAGNVCDYTINVLSGSTVGAPPNAPGPVSGPLSVCQNSAGVYSIAPPLGATIYNWSLNPASAGTISGTGSSITVNWNNSHSGPVELCVDVANACFPNTTPSCITVDVSPQPTAVLSGSALLCPDGSPSSGSPGMSVNFTGNPPWTFVYTINGAPQPAITTSDNPYNLMPNGPGNYTLVSVSSGTCTGTATGSATVSQNNLNASATSTGTTCGQSNGSVNLTVTGGTTPYTFAWDNSSMSEDLTGVPAGQYTVTVTDANGCTRTATATVSDNPINFSISGTTTANTSCNTGNGSVNITVNPAGSYTYLWSPNGEITEDLTNVPAGSYTVTVTTGVTCTNTATFTVSDQPNTPNPTLTATATTCDFSNGAVNLTVSGGVTPYTFQWESGQNTEDLSAIPAGTYTVTVTGANGCTASASITVSNNNPPINITGTTLPNTSCNASNNGSVDITVTPGGPTYTYNWDPGGAVTQDLTGLPPGTYTVTVSAGGSCTQTASFTVADNPNTPAASASTTPTTCDLANGNVNLSVSGGVPPYTFLWDNAAITQNLTGVSAGTYTVTVTGANGCTTVTSATLANNNPTITITATTTSNTTCNGNNNGGIDITVTPANPAYTYLWDPNGQVTPDLTNVGPGTYTVTVNGGGSCTQTASFTIADNPNTPNASATTTPTTCDLANGNINLSVSGGVAPYTFIWDNAAITQNLTGVTAGTYTVTVTGANGCTTVTSVTLANNNPPINITGVTQVNTVCNGASNGSIDITVSPANSYTYLWSPNGAITQDLTGLSPGTYTVVVTTGVSCTAEESFTVGDQANLPVLSAITVPSTCDLANGSINLTITGGIAPYAIAWNHGPATEDLNGLLAGTYTVVVTGANGCFSTLDITVSNNNPPITISDNIQPNTACGINGNGSINITVTPAGTYTWLWSPGGEMTQNISGLTPGFYSVTVSGQGSCSETATFIVPDDPNLPDINLAFTPSTCGQNNGAVNLTVSGGVQPYTFQWSNSAATEDLNGVPAGLYTVTVTGANGCVAESGGNVDDELVDIEITETIVDQSSCLTNNGSISIAVTPPNLTIVWDNGSSSPVRNNLPPGDYSVTVSAGGTCTETATFFVNDVIEYPTLIGQVTEATCGRSDGAVELDVFGGVLPYTYTWTVPGGTQDLNNVPEGDYSVTVTTALGCSAEAQYFVPNNIIPIDIFGTLDNNSSCTSPNGFIDISIEPVSPANNYNVVWMHGPVNVTTLENLPEGDYSVTVTLGTGCSAESFFVISNSATPPNVSASASPATCGVNNGAINLTVNGGVPPYSFQWSPGGQATEDLVNLTPGNYTVTVTGFNDCTATTSVQVTNNNIAINLSGVPAANTSCTTPDGSVNLSVTPAGSYNFAWSNMTATEDLSGVAPGSYTVTVSLGTCTATATYNVGENTTEPVISSAITPSVCGDNGGAIDLTISAAPGPFTFNWNPAAATEDLTGLLSGTYAVTVTAANGCSATATLNVPNNSSTFSLAGTATPLTRCDTANGAIDLIITPPGLYGITWSSTDTTEDLGNLPAGNYTVTVTDFGSCTASIGFTIEDLRTYPQLAQTITPELCDLLNGAVAVETSGGTPPYTYLWNPAASTEDLNGIAAGAYSLTTTDANGCTASLTANVPANSITFSLAGNTTANTSCIQPNGAVDLEVTPPGSYTYLWSNMDTTQDIGNLQPGIYSVTVSAGGSCTNVASFTITSSLPPPQITENVTPALCAQSSGAINVTVQSGVGPFTYFWNDAVITEDRTGLAPGSYALTVTGANGCTAAKTINVPQNVVTPAITGTAVANTSCVNPNGSVSVSVTPTTLTYTYTWSNMATGPVLSDLQAGSYTVTVSAGGGCTNTATVTVTSTLPPPQISQVITPAFCGQSSGAITLSIAGGVAPFSFEWENADTTSARQNLASGTYSVTVTGANGCTASASLMVPENTVTPVIVPTITENTSCADPNGAISIAITPTTLSYDIVWSTGDTTAVLDSLLPGMYTVTVFGGGACTATAQYTVPTNTQSPTLQHTQTNINCFGDLTGSINVTVNGGQPPYSYNWLPVQPGNPEDLAGIGAGTYNLTVTDALGCAVTGGFTITQPAEAVQVACAEVTTVSAPGATDGEGSVTVSGGVAPYQINWSPGGTAFTSNGGVSLLPNLGEDGYTVTVTDANGCPAFCNFTIGLVNCVTAVGSMQSTTAEACGESCATVTYNATGQNLDPDDVLQFILHTGNSNQIVGELARSATPEFCFIPGTMQYGVTYYISAAAGDNNGNGQVDLTDFCTVVAPGTPVVFYEIPVAGFGQPEPLNCAVSQVEISGISSLPGSSFAWSTDDGVLIGNTTQQTVLAGEAGIYELVVGRNGCFDTTDVLVIDQSNTVVANAQATPNGILDCIISEILLSGEVEGTTNPSTIWLANGITYPNSTVLSIDTPGTYIFIAIDTLTFCSDTATLMIDANLAFPPLFLNPHGPLTCAIPAITLSGGSPIGGIDFRWAQVVNGDTIALTTGTSLQVTTAGTYLLIGYDPVNQCTNALETDVAADVSLPVAVIDGPDSIACFGSIDILDGTGSTGNASLTFQWSTANGSIASGITAPAAQIDAPGTYNLRVTNTGNGCVDNATITVSPREPVASARVIQPPCFGDRGAIIIDSVSGARPPVRYSLNGALPSLQSSYQQLPEGVYTLVITDALGCSTTVTAELIEPEIFTLDLITEALIALGDTLVLEANANVPDSLIAWVQWSPTESLSCDTCLTTLAFPFNSTRYQVEAETNTGCSDRAAVTVLVDRRINIYAPNIFAPDDAGLNDKFMLYGNPDKVKIVKKFLVFSRWGELVHEYYNFVIGDPAHGWNGNFNGQKLNPAVFVWYAEVELINGDVLFLEGDVTLKR